MVVDKTLGDVYVIQETGFADTALVYKYDYDSDTWTQMNSGKDGGYFVGDIDAWGGRVGFLYNPALGSYRVRRYDGSSWDETGADNPGDNALTSAQPMAISPSDEYYYWLAWNSVSPSYRWVKGSVGGASSIISWPGPVYPTAQRKDQMWFYPGVGGHVRLVRIGSWAVTRETQLGITDDHFSDVDVYSLNNGAKNLYNVSSILFRTRDTEPGWAIFGSDGYSGSLNESTTLTATPHCVLVADIFADADRLYGKAGSLCATAPYTNSIPRISGGPVKNGILICD
jgi:hypothetical protein